MRATAPTETRKIIVGANLQTHDAVHVLAARGKQQDRNPRFVAQPPQHFEAIQAGQHDVEHHQQKVSIQRHLQAASSVGRGLDLKAFRGQILAHQAAQFNVVIDDQ